MKKTFIAVTFLCALTLANAGSVFGQNANTREERREARLERQEERRENKAPEMAIVGELFAAISGFAGYYAIRRRKA